MAEKIVQKGSPQYQRNLAKQQFLNLNGIKVKLDGSWGPWQEEQYRKLTTKSKYYNTTPLGLLSYAVDKISGNTTYQEDPPIVSGNHGEIKPDNRSKFGRTVDYLLQHNDNPLGYTYQTILPTLGAAATLVNPAVAIRAAIPGIIVGGTTSYAFDELSKAATGKTIEEQSEPIVGKELSFLANPGTYMGGKTGYNYKNLGRFVVDNVYPASYQGHGKDFARAYAQALNPFSRVPHFFNGKRPKWYKDRYSAIKDNDFRLENMAQWAGIPEKEIPRVVTVDNGDGTRGFTRTVEYPFLPDTDKPLNIGDKIISEDLLFGVGGEHSDYTYKGSIVKNLPNNDKAKRSLWLYEDEQKINPQHVLADKIKGWFNIKKDSKPAKFIDYFGGKDLKWMLGFDNDIKYKQFLYNDEILRYNPKTGRYESIADKISTVPYDEIGQQYK